MLCTILSPSAILSPIQPKSPKHCSHLLQGRCASTFGYPLSFSTISFLMDGDPNQHSSRMQLQSKFAQEHYLNALFFHSEVLPWMPPLDHAQHTRYSCYPFGHSPPCGPGDWPGQLPASQGSRIAPFAPCGSGRERLSWK